jgi:hypothetical protein
MNGERASLRSPFIGSKMRKTRRQHLQLLVQRFCNSDPKAIWDFSCILIFLLHSVRLLVSYTQHVLSLSLLLFRDVRSFVNKINTKKSERNKGNEQTQIKKWRLLLTILKTIEYCEEDKDCKNKKCVECVRWEHVVNWWEKKKYNEEKHHHEC